MTVATVPSLELQGADDPVRMDQDGDGISLADGDCDDRDDTVFPGAVEACDGVDNDCAGGVDDLGVCTRERSWVQLMHADVLFVVDTNSGMDPLLLDVADLAHEVGEQLGGDGSDVHVGVTSMAVTGDLFASANRSFVSGGTHDGAYRIGEWLRVALESLPLTEDRGRGRDSVLALLTDDVPSDDLSSSESSAEGADGAEGDDSKDGDDSEAEPKPDRRLVFGKHGGPDFVPEGSPDGNRGAGAVESFGSSDADVGRGREGGPMGFRREHTPLAMVFVSRSDDDSSSSTQAFFETLAPLTEEGGRTAHAIVGLGARCEGTTVSIRTTYERLAEQTDGVLLDVCDLQTGDLAAIGAHIAREALVDRHPLPADVDLQRPLSLTAELHDGTVVPVKAATFSVDVRARELVLDAPPPAGSVLRLTYDRMP